MSGPSGMTCGTCVFADMTNISSPFCRRNPPQLVVVRLPSSPTRPQQDNGVRKFWPTINPTGDWCGEHSAGKAESSN